MRQTIETFVAQRQIKMHCDWSNSNPNINLNNWSRIATHWKCVFKLGKRRLTAYFSQGTAYSGKPAIEDVLDCLASDAAGLEDSFENWCNAYGYNTNSREAERTYKIIQRQSAKLAKFLGDQNAYQSLLFSTERQ